MEELNSGPPKTNPSSGREEDLNSGLPDYKSSAVTTRPRSPPIYITTYITTAELLSPGPLKANEGAADRRLREGELLRPNGKIWVGRAGMR